MKVVVLLICEEDVYQGGLKTLNSISYFHPEFEIVKYGKKEISRLQKELNCQNMLFLTPIAMKEVWHDKKPDLLIKIGGDLLVLGKLNEVLNSEYCVAAGRNDPDLVTWDESHNRPYGIKDVPNNEWVNADFICVKNEKFIEDYYNVTMEYATGKRFCVPGHLGDDQHSLNLVFRIYGYKSLILDKRDSGVIYNASGNWSGEDQRKEGIPEVLRKAGLGANTWTSWKYINFNGSECVLPDNGIGCGERVVKVLHQGGGTWEPKLSWELFNPTFREYLFKVTGFDK